MWCSAFSFFRGDNKAVSITSSNKKGIRILRLMLTLRSVVRVADEASPEVAKWLCKIVIHLVVVGLQEVVCELVLLHEFLFAEVELGFGEGAGS